MANSAVSGDSTLVPTLQGIEKMPSCDSEGEVVADAGGLARPSHSGLISAASRLVATGTAVPTAH